MIYVLTLRGIPVAAAYRFERLNERCVLAVCLGVLLAVTWVELIAATVAVVYVMLHNNGRKP